MSEKFKVAVDVDGVLADFTGRIASFYGVDMPEQTTWGNITPPDVDPELFWKHACASPEFYAGCKPMPDAFKIVNRLKEVGHAVFLATQCSHLSAPHKANWVQRYFGDIPVVYFVGESKLDYKWDWLIDDHPDLVDHERVLSYPAPYNKAFIEGDAMVSRRRIFWTEFQRIFWK